MAEKITKLDPEKRLEHDAKLWISTGRNRFDKKWKNKQILWSRLVHKLETPIRTPETYAEYTAATKADQDRIKDVGGFVGGTLQDGKRGSHTVTGRTILSFDLDFAPESFYEDYTLLADYASACYSTHKHRPTAPRYRLLVPLSRTVTADEYEAVSRMIASDIGMDYFDPSTFQPSRLMYWPSCSEDGEYYFSFFDAPFLDPDTVLERYPDWHDASQWPTSEKEASSRKALADKQADPTSKPGVVGAFCRAYDVPSAIGTFLSDIYTPTDKEDRYTYAAGSTAAGLVLYNDGAFAYSNHGTDPAGGQLCNAFDLVRIHLFGAEDENVSGDTPTNKRPSYKAMIEFAAADKETRLILDRDRHEEAVADFSDDPDPDAWRAKLERKGAKGDILKNVLNCERIFKNDPQLQGLSLNLLTNSIEVLPDKPVPWDRQPGQWTDTDDAQLFTYIGKEYAEFPRAYINDQKLISASSRAFHPIKQYLEQLPEWDGEPRVDTLLIDYLGAEDNIFTREATARILTAAVRRIYEPGCKFDTVLVLAGPPGIGKSMLIEKLAGQWFSDNLSFDDMKDKTAAEKLQGYWIIEIAEMKGMRKMDVESIKSFVSRQEDIYRAAYGHNTERHPRQSVFFGTVNDISGYLKDITGNRRFWPISIATEPKRHPWDMTPEDRAQIWAEVMFRYKSLGERSLILSPEAEKIALEKQTEAIEADDREGMVEEYLNTLLPVDWDLMDREARLDFLDEDYDVIGEPVIGTEHRTEVSNLEVWCECFRRPANAIQSKDSYQIAAILKRLGWERSSKRKRIPLYGLQRLYMRPVTSRSDKPVTM